MSCFLTTTALSDVNGLSNINMEVIFIKKYALHCQIKQMYKDNLLI